MTRDGYRPPAMIPYPVRAWLRRALLLLLFLAMLYFAAAVRPPH